MERIATSIVLLAAFLLVMTSFTEAVEPAPGSNLAIQSSMLVGNSSAYDGKAIIFFGEIVGGVMERGDFVWVNVHDGEYAIGVYAPKELFNYSVVSGDYNHKGDMIEVAGVFNRACREHGGDTDLHARTLRVVARGYEVGHPLSMSKVFLTLLLLVMNIPLLIILNRVTNAPK
jgi:hypothetical protein